ncbi:MAG: hypothetical protein CM15mP46_5280 [Alphaproteobacteria bacterium]|nr:MAG: hypothetical protein CM15mP46_5280 [Alphaproteobacteria bacterium]
MINKQPAFSAKNFYKNSANCQIKNSYLENLKTQIAGIDGRISRQFMPLAVDSLDSALSGGLALGRVHMMCGMMQAHGAVSGFVTALLMRLVAHLSAVGTTSVGPIVWCPASSLGGAGMLYGHGLAALGLDPARLLIVDTPHPSHRMAALDDIARTDGLTAVVAEYDGMQKSSDYWMRLMRRIQLAAESSRVTVFLLGAPLAANGCETVWHIAPTNMASADKMAGHIPHNRPHRSFTSSSQSWCPRWQITLKRARGGYPFQGQIGWEAWCGRFIELSAMRHNHVCEQMLFDRGSEPLPPTHQNLTANQAMPQAV